MAQLQRVEEEAYGPERSILEVADVLQSDE